MKGKKTQKTIRSYAPHLAAAAFVMVLVTVLALFAPAYAATSGPVTGLTDTSIGLSYSGDADDPWKVEVVDDKQQIIGSVKGTKGRCDDTHYKSTLTITNKKSTPATLSFDYVIEQNDGTIQVDEIAVTKDGPFSKELTANGSIKIYIKSGSTSKATKITIKNILLVYKTKATTTFLPADDAMMGSYSVDGTAVTEIIEKTQESSKAYELVAKPKDDYRFMGWYDATAGEYIGIENPYSLRSENDRKITAKFTKKGAAIFAVGKKYYDDLNAAVAYAKENAKSTVTLVSDGTLAAGDYTISSGITLLIPFDAAGTLYADTPTASTTKTKPSPFRTLTLASGASITVNGAISVGGQYYAAGGGQEGQMTGPYGWIKLEQGSGITVENGGNLYAWGFVSGEGSVTVNSGGTVYEWFQLMDFRGGQETVFKMLKKGVFVISQYTVQNIEAQLTIKEKANEIAYAAIEVGGINYTKVSFIGSNGMFKINSGSLTKKYDRKTDRVKYAVNGTAELNNMSITMTVFKISYTIDSKDYALPLTNNMTVTLKSDSKLTVNQDTALLPGVQINIDQKAELCVPSGYSMYVYDKAQWGGYCGAGNKEFFAVPYVTDNASRYTRTSADLLDAEVKVNGTLTAAGAIYTTADGAKIWSEGTGKFVQQGAVGTATKTYQHVQGEDSNKDIPITPARLLNKDGSYTETAGKSAGTTISYVDGRWTEAATVKFVGNDGTASDESLLTQTVDLLKENATVNYPIFEKAGYKFLGFAKTQGATKPDFSIGKQILVSALGAKTGDTVTLYAVYEAEFRTVTWKVTGVTGVTVDPTQVDPKVGTLTKTVKELFGDSARYFIMSCTISPESGAKQTVKLPADNIKLTNISSNITVTLELAAYDHIVTVKDTSGSSETHYVAKDLDVLTGESIGYTVSGRKLITEATGNACNINVNGTKTAVTVTNITDDTTVTVTLAAYDHIVTINAGGGNSQTYYVKNNGNVLANNAPITYTATGQNVISGVTILPDAAKETHDATTATITDITDSVTVTVALKSYDYLVTIKAGGSSETHYVKGDKDVLTNAAITYTAGENQVITGITGGGATFERGEGDVNAEVADGWKSFTLSGIKKDQTVAVTLKDYDWTVNWTLEKQDHGITAKEVSRSYVEDGATAVLSMNGFRATGVNGADSAAVTGIGTGVVTISNITANLTVTVTARNYSYAVTWNVNGTQAKTDYLAFDVNTATYDVGTATVITKVSVTPAEKATVSHTNTTVTVTGISSDVTVLVTTETPTTDKATYYFGDMSYEYKRNTVLYQWDGKSEDKGQWIPVDSFAWQHKAGSRIYEFEDSSERYVVPNGSVLLVNGSNQTMQYTVTYTPDGELTNAAMTFTAGEKTGSNILSVVLKPGEKIMVSSTFACDVTDKTLTNAPAGQVTVTTEPYNN